MIKDLQSLKRAAWRHGQFDNVGFAERFLLRPISIRITYVLIGTRLRPTHITLLGFFVAIVGAILFTFGGYLLTVFGAVAVYFSHVLDDVDGEIARAKKQSSSAGQLLDEFVDRLVEIAVYSGVSIGLFTATKSIAPLLVGAFVVTSTFFLADMVQKINRLQEQNASVKRRRGRVTYFQYGESSNSVILLAASVLNRVFEGMLLMGTVTFAYPVARFVLAYISFRGNKAKRN